MSADRYNFTTELLIDVVCFYIGVVLFVCICMIPPLTIALPYTLPITFLACIIMNIGFIIRFTKGTQNELEKKFNEFSSNSVDYIDALDQLT
jgi:hypothetical protein